MLHHAYLLYFYAKAFGSVNRDVRYTNDLPVTLTDTHLEVANKISDFI